MLKHIKASEDWSSKSVAEKGFTLIELLVVIAILGVLAVVGVLAFGGLTDKAKSSVAKTEKTQVQTAVDAWRADSDPVAAYVGPYAWDEGTTPAELVAEKVFKTGSTLQCAYTADDDGDVTFQALADQDDENCQE